MSRELRLEKMKAMYLRLVAKAEKEGNIEKAEKFKIAAKRCESG